ncbi:uncharacterized protein LOC113465082 [Ceratina calcarata]|uniref:Uncharacterized protein LOC113465082 n=1 Tax=Ceratina calcarata TaxID=156304 RepID=A0AAJ7SC19_9HYME|nr:uncharacterized protein LOC113465082 [Ceratina calcarata]
MREINAVTVANEFGRKRRQRSYTKGEGNQVSQNPRLVNSRCDTTPSFTGVSASRWISWELKLIWACPATWSRRCFKITEGLGRLDKAKMSPLECRRIIAGNVTFCKLIVQS